MTLEFDTHHYGLQFLALPLFKREYTSTNTYLIRKSINRLKKGAQPSQNKQILVLCVAL